MKIFASVGWTTLLMATFGGLPLGAEEPVTLENVPSPGKNRADEPVRKEFSLDAAVRFLDVASLDWQKKRKCFTCHTNFAYLMARPAIGFDVPAHRQSRAGLEELVTKRWVENGPRWDAEVVMSAAVLAINDSSTTGKLHPATQAALERMWTTQRDDGGWNWLKCNWPPMESDDHFGATMAALAVGAAPGDYQKTEAAKNGLEKLRKYFAKNPPPTLHHRAMMLWAASYTHGIVDDKTRRQTIADLFKLQKTDGGWGLATLGDWKRADQKPQDLKSSDGYGTGFVIFVLRKSGVPAKDPRLKNGIAWLKQNQRQSGRWFTRSLNKDNKHFISHAGTAFAVMALAECETSPAKK